MTAQPTDAPGQAGAATRQAVIVVAALNLAYGLIEFGTALRIGSVSLFADSIDFFEDGAVNILISLAMGWTAVARQRVGVALALILFIPAAASLWVAVAKLMNPVPPAAPVFAVTALGALAVNLLAAFILARHRRTGGSLALAAWLSARNDALANLAMIAAALVTGYIWHSAWPDLIVGLGIFYLNLDAARDVLAAARAERDPAQPRT